MTDDLDPTDRIVTNGQSTYRVAAVAREVIAEVLFQRAFVQVPDKESAAANLAGEIVRALRREGVLKGLAAPNAGEVLAKYGDGDLDRPVRGVSHLVAEALVLMDLDLIHRDTLQALIPDSVIKAAARVGQPAAQRISRALRRFDSYRWIQRSEAYVAVLDRGALVEWYKRAYDPTSERARASVDVAKAIQLLAQKSTEGGSPAEVELRRRELLAVQRLMSQGPVVAGHGVSTKRVVPAGRTL